MGRMYKCFGSAAQMIESLSFDWHQKVEVIVIGVIENMTRWVCSVYLSLFKH